ncbi:hypothetical protein [Rhodoferax koreensis]|uniref:hypothetical protein n=1 Tax=Rhodoferax koreensis TaxID=1842727 RepID=UPI0012FF6FC0|nr:hypothetical protein [Rhodoferax koreense]
MYWQPIAASSIAGAPLGSSSRSWYITMFGSQWQANVQSRRASWGDQQRACDMAMQRARAAQPVQVTAGPSAAVLATTSFISGSASASSLG